MKDSAGQGKQAPGEGAKTAHNDRDVDVVRGDTQIYGVTAPDHSRPRIQESTDHESHRPSSVVSFGDKKIDMSKLRESYIGETVSGRFKIKEFIDRGGMGEVYLAENDAVGQRVAVKFLNRKFTSDESIVTRFGNEAKSYARVNHPNAVTLLDYGQHDDGALYIITEFVDGLSLAKTIKKRGPFTPQQVISVGQQCCDVLTTAHKLGVIHRDLKPDNIMLIQSSKDRFTVKILDFGIAKLSDDDQGSMTETGAIFGTPEFMSPEQARGDGAEPRSDLYALGAILYYMLTGKLPFSGKNKFAVLNKHLNDPVPLPSQRTPHLDIPPTLEAVILKCMNKLPEERYTNAEALYEALDEVRDILGGSGGMTTSAPPTRSHTDRDKDEPVVVAKPVVEEQVSMSVDLDPQGEDIQQEVELAQKSVPGVQLGEYASLPDTDIRDEIDDLARDDEDDDLWDDEPYIEQGGGRLKLLMLAVVLMVVVVGGWFLWQGLGSDDSGSSVMTRVGDGSIDAITGVNASDAGDEIEQILVTSQVLGLLASAEQELQAGDLVGARKKVETTKMWLDDTLLPAEGAKRRKGLEETLDRLIAKEKELKGLRANNECKQLASELVGLSDLSEGLAKKWEVIEQECASAINKVKSAPKVVPPSKRTDTPVKVAPQPVKKDTMPKTVEKKDPSPKKDADVKLPSPGDVVQGVGGDSKEKDKPVGEDDTLGMPPKTL